MAGTQLVGAGLVPGRGVRGGVVRVGLGHVFGNLEIDV